MNWINLEQLLLKSHAGRVVTIDPPLDHAQLCQRALSLAAGLRARNVQCLALHLEDAAELAIALLAAWRAGVAVLLLPDLQDQTRQRWAQQVDLWLTASADLDDLPAAPLAPAALDLEQCRLSLCTSGSSGEPKLIEKSLRQLANEVLALEQLWGADLGQACIIGSVAAQHIYGLLFRVLWPLAAGRAIQPRRFFHEDLVSALAREPSVLVATPAHLKRLPGQLDWAALSGRLRAVFSSGGPLPSDAALQARALLGVAPTEVFGSSETGGIAWRQWSAEQPQWHPLPGVAWRIEDGCLAVSSPHLADDAWWQTQDRVEADAGRSFRLLGRADRIVKIEERRVSLDALEQQLRAHPQVQEARVLVLPGAREQLAAVVVPQAADATQWSDAQRRLLAGQLGAHLAQSHDAVTRPRRWRFVNELPYNAQGKTTAAALAALFRPLLPAAQWQQRDADAAVLVLPLDPDLVAFDGHFPQAKILPGVVQLDWAIHYARQAFAMPPRFERMDALKFQHVARPDDQLQLTLGWDAARSVLSFRYLSDHGVHASGRVVFGDA